MHNELRYHAKIQVISDMPRKEKIKFLAFSPNIFFFKLKNKNMFYGNNFIRSNL
jgi:hypothetical protein